ncbi:MAG: hypothetical protein FWG34_11365 [Oscillospiraceae bacterium]|nr:hypothetical protein [Oscillospiraceae bacterium]
MYETLNIAVAGDARQCARLAELICEWLAEKGFENSGGDSYKLTLKFDPSVDREGYVFAPSERGGQISASCLSGLYAGAGHFLLGSRIYGKKLRPPEKHMESAPKKSVRGIYFATHFHNFYHDAPVCRVKRYVEELSLWGYNMLTVWFDMHHYTGMDDPEAKEMVSRLRLILEAARVSGMKLCLGVLANEGFSGTPDELKADWRAGQNGYHAEPMGHYHVEICPNSPGGMEQIIKNREEVCEAFRGVDFEYIWLWPYDQGGCTCEKCSPWGARGFLKTSRLVADACRKYSSCKFIMSLWYFDNFIKGETEAFKKAFANDDGYVSYILCEPHHQSGELPAHDREICGLGIVGFPEISMYGASPWGGFGANPIPQRIRHIWDIEKAEMQGGFPYSEGIYEDINKYIISRLYWHGDYDANAAMEEYAGAYFGGGCAGEIAAALAEMEKTLPRQMTPDGAALQNPAFCREIYSRIAKCDSAISPAARASWRWRIIYLRALIDNELSSNNFAKRQICKEAYSELIGIYHAQNADPWVRPPLQ